jgi:DNA repair protein RecN (Recombination protein N)
MLSFLKIENLAVVDALSAEFGEGLNVLTGETGAGKSIIVDAVGLLLGERGGADLVRTGCERLVVEGIFEPEPTAPRGALRETLGAMGIEPGPEGIVLRREITSAGRSRAFVNGRLATLQQLKEIGEHLADLHGQHQHQSLLRPDGQREALDRFGGHAEIAEEVARASADLRALLSERAALRGTERERARREDALASEIREIEAAAPKPGEEEDLRREEALLRHAEEIRALAEEACAVLNEEDDSVLARLGTVRERIARLAAIDGRAGGALRTVEEARIALKEALREVEPYREAGDMEPGRLDAVAARLAALDRLKRKYGATAEDVLDYLARARRDLEALGGAAGRLSALDGEVEAASAAYAAAAGRLSRKRREAARALEAALRKELRALAMDGCRFGVELRPREDPAGEAVVEGRRVEPSRDGCESVAFLIAPNPGEDPRPLARIASGGELSRLMLAIRAASEARTDARALVFDEVDAGIGGEVVEAVAERLKALAARQQVLCVTHLPRIAAAADRHLRVEKSASGGRTRATVALLERDARVEELARMLGSAGAPTARRHAAALIGARKAP